MANLDPTPDLPETKETGDLLTATDVNQLRTAIAAIAKALGTIDDGDVATVAQVLAAIQANDWVVAARIATDAVETAKIKDGAVTTGKIGNLAVTAGKLAANAVETAKIANGAVTAGKLATDAVETAKIKDAAVTAAKVAADVATQAELDGEAEARADGDDVLATRIADLVAQLDRGPGPRITLEV